MASVAKGMAVLRRDIDDSARIGPLVLFGHLVAVFAFFVCLTSMVRAAQPALDPASRSMMAGVETAPDLFGWMLLVGGAQVALSWRLRADLGSADLDTESRNVWDCCTGR